MSGMMRPARSVFTGQAGFSYDLSHVSSVEEPRRAPELFACLAASLDLGWRLGRLFGRVRWVGVLGEGIALALVQHLVQVRQVLVGKALGALQVHKIQMLNQVGFGAVRIGHLR